VRLALELLCWFGLGLMMSTVIGIAVAWAQGLYHAEPLDHDDESRAVVPYASGGGHGWHAPTRARTAAAMVGVPVGAAGRRRTLVVLAAREPPGRTSGHA
jgi:hypothetical protein